MSTGSIHHRATHRSRRLALPAVVIFGLTIAAQWSTPFHLALWSPAHAEVPSSTRKKVEPRVVDFTKLAKQKAEARRWMQDARKAAANGDVEAACRHANHAASIPVEWNLGEIAPQKFLEDIQSNPEKFSEPVAEISDAPVVKVLQRPLRRERTIEVVTPNHADDRDAIELSFPDDQPGVTNHVEEDLTSAADAPSPLKINQEFSSRLAQSETSKTPRTPGFKTVESAASIPESVPAAPRTKQRFTPIPSLEELAEPAPLADPAVTQSAERAVKTSKKSPSTTAKRLAVSRRRESQGDSLEDLSGTQATDQPQGTSASPGRLSLVQTSPRSDARDQTPVVETDPVEPPLFLPLVNADDAIPAERMHGIDSPMTSRRGVTRQRSDQDLTTSSTEATSGTPPFSAMPTSVVLDSRITEQPAVVDQTANVIPASASQLVMNLNNLLMAILIGVLLVVTAAAMTVLRKFGPNPQFTFKVELSNPNAVALGGPVVKDVAPMAHVLPAAPVTTSADFAHAAPIHVLKRQVEEAIEHHQEDAMMRQVFDDNLKLREQLEDIKIAA